MSVIPPTPVDPTPAPKPPAPAPAGNLFTAAANDAIAAAPTLVGFDFTIITQIITALVGIFQGCMKPPTPAAARQHVVDHYNPPVPPGPGAGWYDRGVMRVATHQAKLAAHQAGTRVDNAEADALARATLDQIRTSDDATIQAAMDATKQAE